MEFVLDSDLEILEKPVYKHESGRHMYHGVIYMKVTSKSPFVGGQSDVGSFAFWMLSSEEGRNKLDVDNVGHLSDYTKPSTTWSEEKSKSDSDSGWF